MSAKRKKTLRILLIALVAALMILSPLLAANPGQSLALAQGVQNYFLPLIEHNHISPNPDFVDNPPIVQDASLQMLPAPTPDGDALLAIKFQDGQDLPEAFSFQLEKQLVLLHDDGQGPDQGAHDGLYSAILQLDLESLQATNRHIEEWAGQSPAVPVFDQQRSLADLVKLQPFDLERLKRGELIKLFPFPFGIPLAIDAGRTLLIRDPSVVEDPGRTFNPCSGVGTPMGSWTFGKLMTDMANQPVTGIDPSTFVRKWLGSWEVNQNINSDLVPARINIKTAIIDPWEAASGGPGHPLNLAIAPFRLLAIVNRVDLRQNLVYGHGSAGEARFVFEPLDVKHGCAPLQFTVIFEYGVPKNGCIDVRTWGKEWLDLQSLPLGSPAYLAALQAITDHFATANADPTKLPNMSALNQLRTNEIALAAPWELREFQISRVSGMLEEVTVKQTPAFAFNHTTALANYVNGRAAAILAGKDKVPDDWPLPGMPFLGGSAPTPFGMFWDGPAVPPGPDIVPANARQAFSLSTCNGCHAGETNTAFTHIHPAPFGVPAGLSGFLTGINVADPADGAPVRHFADLDRRAADLDTLTHSSCLFDLFHVPLKMVH